jgi:hypothetical protein
MDHMFFITDLVDIEIPVALSDSKAVHDVAVRHRKSYGNVFMTTKEKNEERGDDDTTDWC